MKLSYRSTMFACFAGYVVQSVVNNFVPLLFVIFQDTYGIPLGKITLLVTFNFGVQLTVDLLSAKFIDKLGYRVSMLIAHICSAAGLVLLAVLPGIMDPFAGLLISVMIYAIGGGILEVLVTPITECCPTDNKEASVSLLHSIYCWGHIAVVVLSTAFFKLFGTDKWQILALLWTIIPVLNGILFTKVPIGSLLPEGDKGMTIKELFKNKVFWVLMVMMICAGASEQGVSQWASAFAERGLGIDKAIGDLAGPLSFAFCMALSRTFYGKFGDKIDLDKFMKWSAVLCIGAYLTAALAPHPALNLLGCGICGLSVGIMWPGSFSRASRVLPRGGTAMFALLALGGDFGCSLGPTVVGTVSDLAKGNLHLGVLAAVVFPALMALCLIKGGKKDDVLRTK